MIRSLLRVEKHFPRFKLVQISKFSDSIAVEKDFKFTKEHEWVKIADKEAQVGITDYAQKNLGEVVFISLPDVGQKLKQGETFGSVESSKAASDLYAPVDGQVVEVNEKLHDNPELINSSPYEEGWLIKLADHSAEQTSKLLNFDDYVSFIKHD